MSFINTGANVDLYVILVLGFERGFCYVAQAGLGLKAFLLHLSAGIANSASLYVCMCPSVILIFI